MKAPALLTLMPQLRKIMAVGLLSLCILALPRAYGESQNNDYKGITDPFGDPANYEFADDEKDDKEFFHLGRFIMLGIDAGIAIFTGGLGASTDPGFYIGGRLLYFFDKSLAMELAVHYSSHNDIVVPLAGAATTFSESVIPLTIGLRYYFDTQEAPRAIAAANPYLALGAGDYLRSETVVGTSSLQVTNNGSTSSNFGGYAGAGIEFPIYKRHIYLGIDGRFHLVFWQGASDTANGALAPGSRSGDYFTTNGTITYSF
jgi:Outer membrane protein beta-barrel domain